MYNHEFNSYQSETIANFFEYYDMNAVSKLNNRYIDLKRDSSIYLNHTYQSILAKTAKLFNELGQIDTLCVSVLFEYLLWNGYFSKDKSFKYSLAHRKNIPTVLGASIMNGSGVCLNICSMLVKIFNKLGMEAHLIGVRIPAEVPSGFYVPDINRKILRDRVSNNNVSNKRANHALCLVKENDSYFYVDANNLLFANNSDVLKVSYVGFEEDLIVDVFPYVTFFDECLCYSEFVSLFNNLFHAIFNDHLTLEKVRDVSESMLDVCRNNVSLFDDFHHDILCDIDNVCRTLNM